MGRTVCLVPGCQPSKNDARHRFPNQKNFVDSFLLWLQIINNTNIKDLDNMTIYKNYRVCDKHFVPEDHTTNNRLKKKYLPTATFKRHFRTVSENDNSTVSCLPTTSGENISYLAYEDHTYSKVNICRSKTPLFFSDNRPPVYEDYASSKIETARSVPPLSYKRGLLRGMGIFKSCELSPKAKIMYRQALYYKRKATVLNSKKLQLKQRLKILEKNLKEKSFMNLFTIKAHINFNFIECEHSKTLCDDILQGFLKLVIFNYFNDVNNVIMGKDERKKPASESLLWKQAKEICNKRKRYSK